MIFKNVLFVHAKRELICLLLFTCNYVVSVRRVFLFLWVLGMGYVILLWHSLSLPYNYFVYFETVVKQGFLVLLASRVDCVIPLWYYPCPSFVM